MESRRIKENKMSEDVQEIRKATQPIRCSKIQANQSQCQRLADVKMPTDTENRYAMCQVCWLLSGSKPEFSEKIERD